MEERKKYVYVAGPYTKPEPVENVHRAIAAGDALARAGYLPYIPHLTMFWHLVRPHEPDFWYAFDLEWLLKCDVLLRLPGDSWGADQEVLFAEKNDIPVFFGTALKFIEQGGEQ